MCGDRAGGFSIDLLPCKGCPAAIANCLGNVLTLCELLHQGLHAKNAPITDREDLHVQHAENLLGGCYISKEASGVRHDQNKPLKRRLPQSIYQPRALRQAVRADRAGAVLIGPVEIEPLLLTRLSDTVCLLL